MISEQIQNGLKNFPRVSISPNAVQFKFAKTVVFWWIRPTSFVSSTLKFLKPRRTTWSCLVVFVLWCYIVHSSNTVWGWSTDLTDEKIPSLCKKSVYDDVFNVKSAFYVFALRLQILSKPETSYSLPDQPDYPSQHRRKLIASFIFYNF